LNTTWWTVKLRLQNRPGWLVFILANEEEKNQLSLNLYQCANGENDLSSFILFDTDKDRVALNTDYVLAWQFCWDAGERFPIAVKGVDEDGEPDRNVKVFFNDGGEALEFDVDYDTAELGSEDNFGEPSNQLQEALFGLETGLEVIDIRDVDGEDVYFKTAEVTLFMVPIDHIENDDTKTKPSAEADDESPPTSVN
jgi:hypothetical protein